MASYLSARASPETDVILLEAPRQHLLAKYYLGDDFAIDPVPAMNLPEFWPVTAPPVVPENVDDQIQSYLAAKDSVWVIFTAENEVDPGEFLAKYLTAVSFKQDCVQWLDVRLCRFLSPHSLPPTTTSAVQQLYAGELLLESASLSLFLEKPHLNQRVTLLAQLDWFATRSPTLDYKVSLRLVDEAGAILDQIDEFPIGTLLLPTTWSAGDRKPGYIALTLPDNLPPGKYNVELALYDPATLAPIARTGVADSEATLEPLVLANLRLDDTMVLLPVRPAR